MFTTYFEMEKISRALHWVKKANLKVTHFMIPPQNNKIRDENEINTCQGLRMGISKGMCKGVAQGTLVVME